jgi:hypothetical protein
MGKFYFRIKERAWVERFSGPDRKAPEVVQKIIIDVHVGRSKAFTTKDTKEY